MQIDIKTSVLQPKRQTFANVARRLGADKPASRYEEGTLDTQPDVNFHYRPMWAPQYELFDRARTAIVMEDWYVLRDPRQYYYGTYTIARSKMIEAEERSFSFVEKRNLMDTLDADWAEKVKAYLVPLRHAEWGANMNNSRVADEGWGTTITQAALYDAMDRLGLAQLISKVGLLLDGNETTALENGKELWMNDASWQPMRKLVEDSLVIEDWFELFVAQNFAMDGVTFPLVFEHFDEEGVKHGGTAVSILCEFAASWNAEHVKWVDAVLKNAAKESEANAKLLGEWASKWAARAIEALTPQAKNVLGDQADAALAEIRNGLEARAKKAGIELA